MKILIAASLYALCVVSACAPLDPNANLPVNDEWASAEEIQIEGYVGNAMEPKMLANGEFLFFNNKTSDDREMDIHYAERRDDTHYEYRGQLTGVDGFLDGVPAVDVNLGFYFVSLRSYEADGVTVYGGDFNGSEVTDVNAVGAGLADTRPGHLIMDVDVTVDGSFLVASRAVFSGPGVPDSSDLDLAARSGATFEWVDGVSNGLFVEVNTSEALEYAGTLSADGLELYYTRTGDLRVETGFAIVVSTRASSADEFGPPERISAIDGAATEGPALSGDGRTLYYHQKMDDTFKIFRVTRP